MRTVRHPYTPSEPPCFRLKPNFNLSCLLLLVAALGCVRAEGLQDSVHGAPSHHSHKGRRLQQLFNAPEANIQEWRLPLLRQMQVGTAGVDGGLHAHAGRHVRL